MPIHNPFFQTAHLQSLQMALLKSFLHVESMERGLEKPGLLCGWKAKEFFQQWPLLPGQCRCQATWALWVNKEVASQVVILPWIPQPQTLLEKHFSLPGRWINGWHGLACYITRFLLSSLSAVGKGWKQNVLGNPGDAGWGYVPGETLGREGEGHHVWKENSLNM